MKQRAAEQVRVMSCLLFGCSLVLALPYPPSLVHAASPITSSGLNTQVTLSGTPPAGKTQYDITGGTRPGGGTNLFHSFGNFNVPTNNIANFLNSGSIDLNGTLLGPNLSVLIDGASSGIFTDTQGTGAGGNTNIASHSVTIQNGGTISAATSGTAPSATGGAININATNGVTLTNSAHVTSSSTGPGIAGDVTINAGNQFTMTNSTVTTEANQSSGGAIKITTNPSGTVQLTKQ